MEFLSTTMSNATEFAEWICYLHKKLCQVVYTDFRPTPLQRYVFPVGGSGLYLIVDENEQFRENNFLKLQDKFTKQKQMMGDVNKCVDGKASGRIARGDSASGGSDIYKIVKLIMERKFQPVIIFSFSTREWEQHEMSMSKLDLNTQEEKVIMEDLLKNGISCLNEEDWSLPAIDRMLPLLQRRIRYVGSGGYIQMSGRAGRRGKDDRGTVIIILDDRMAMNTLKDMISGKPAPLVSTFRLSYYTILNLMSHAEGQFTPEHVIRHSFHQFQYEKALPDIGKRVSKLEDEAALLDTTGEADVAAYHKMKLEIAQLEEKIMAEITRPERVLHCLLPGRLARVQEGKTDWGWKVVMNVVKKPPPPIGTMSAGFSTTRGTSYIVDTLLLCSIGLRENGSRPKSCPSQPGEKGEMHVLPVQLPLISALSKLMVLILWIFIVASPAVTATEEGLPPEMAEGPALGLLRMPEEPPTWLEFLKGLSIVELILIICSLGIGLLAIGVLAYVFRPRTTQDQGQQYPERGPIGGQETPVDVPQHVLQPSTLVYHPGGAIELAVPIRLN